MLVQIFAQLALILLIMKINANNAMQIVKRVLVLYIQCVHFAQTIIFLTVMEFVNRPVALINIIQQETA